LTNVKVLWVETTINEDKGQDTDEWALKEGYVSVVPTQFDLTAHHAIQELNNWNFEK
jgi:5'-nucleotidase